MQAHFFQVSLKDSEAKIDPGTGTIKGVSLISLGEARGHDVFVDITTLRQVFDKAVELGTVKAKADHGSGVFATIGYLDNFSMNEKQVLGDLHIYESEPEKNRIFEIAGKNPNHLGMSIEFTGEDERMDGKMFARCAELITSALVSDPAANKSLFSKKTIDDSESVRSVASKAMAKTTKLEVSDEEKKPSEMETLMTRLEEVESRLSKFEEGVDSSADEGKEEPKATDPSAEPKVENPENVELSVDTDGDGDDDSNTPENPDAEKDAEATAKKAEFSKKSKPTRAEIISLAAQIGMKLMPAGTPDVAKPVAKNFEALVEAKTKEIGNKNAAISFCIANHKAEYAEYRKAFVTVSKSKTL